ncbi:hypothetical protein BD410DRAFT_5394 [Rickenella mellea]|uniref:Uncharacterized protein n=1 Tax=Rickenella mellea TaxID=50990 RepID=A0A4R5XDK5_9AGAM|nr:hypothetical protein BD410DRAFT_5394 [Rickenella mellea]
MVLSPYISDSETNILISALKRVEKNHGYLDGIDLWFEDELHSDICQPDASEKCETCEADNPHWNPNDRRECRKATNLLKELDDTLDFLRNNLAKRLMCIRQRDARFALRDGIRNIPPEILGLVFRFAHSSGRNHYRVTETLSLVCTRFRDTCLQIPQMWSTLRSFDSLDKNRLNLNRSRNATLEITIDHTYHCQPGGRETAQFLELVTPYASRWVSLDIYAEDSCLPGMFANLPNLQLPKLVSIRHAEDIDGAYPGDGHFFYSKRNMPSLSSFYGANVIPNQMSLRSNITKCKLYWKSVHPWPLQSVQCIILGDLTRSLHSLQALPQLELDFDVINMTVTTATPMAVLPNLKSLTLRFGRYMPSNALYELISSFSTPNLDILRLTICNDEIARSCTEIFSHPKTTGVFRNLKSFFLETHDRNDWCLLLKALLCQSPSLLNLTLHAPSASFAHDAGLGTSGKLQTVRFENCDRLSEPHEDNLQNPIGSVN